MDYIQLYAQSQDESGVSSYYELDLHKEEPIKFSKSIQVVQDPLVVSSSFTRTFKVPHTSTNGKFFKAVFNVNSTSFNATKKARAYINIDGAYFASGNIRLMAIYENGKRNKIEYEIVFMGETSTFASVVGPKNLSDLNMSTAFNFNGQNNVALDHAVSYSNITASWNGTLLNGNVLYPLAEYGYTYNPNTKQPYQSTLSIYNGTTSVKGFTNFSNPLYPNQFKPFIRAKYIWDKIFYDAGFTYTSNFLDSTFFKNIYMISSNQSTSTADLLTQPVFQSSFNIVQSILPLSLYNKIISNVVFNDNMNGYNTTDSTYKIGVPGIYNFYAENITCEYQNTVITPAPVSCNVNLAIFKNGVVASTRTAFLDYRSATNTGILRTNPSPSSPSYLISFPPITCNVGDIIDLRISISGASFNYFFLNNGGWGTFGPNAINPSGLMPQQYKQIDFIKGINDRFKLMWEPDPNDSKNFLIEPWIDWIQGGTKRDWTNKLNEEKDVVITPMFYSQNRRIIFKDSEEGDIYNFSYQQDAKQTFGQLNQDSNNELITGDKEIKSIFAPFPLAPIGGTGSFLIPHFAKDTETERQPIQIKPRLCFYNGLVKAPITWYFTDEIFSIAQTNYPLVSSFDRWPFDNSAFDLNWTNVNQFWNPANVLYTPPGATSSVPVTGRTSLTAYSRYWQNWFNYTYDPYSRIMKATFALDSKDIRKLKFNDYIFIKDSWWMPVTIKDYVLGSKQNVEVELIKVGTENLKLGPETPTSYRLGNLCYGATECEAKCCTNPYKVSIWSTTPTITTTSNVYANPSISIFANPGYYSDGTFVYHVSSVGTILGITTGSGCSCAPIGLSAMTTYCTSTTVCGACCCTPVLQSTIWYDGATFSTSFNVYADTSGSPLPIPSSTPLWIKGVGTGADSVLQIGPDGHTVISVGTCKSCGCSPIGPKGNYAKSQFVTGPTYVALACCIENYDINQGYATMYSNNTTFDTSTEFYYDPYGTDPVALDTTLYLTDGKSVQTVADGVVVATIENCDYATYPCSDRNTPITVNINNVQATPLNINVTSNISFDGSVFFYVKEYPYDGVAPNVSYQVYYMDGYSYANIDINVPAQTFNGILRLNVVQSSIMMDSYDFPISAGVEFNYTSQAYLVSGGPYSFDISWL